MKEVRYVITDPLGIHARPAGILVRTLKQFKSSAVLFKGDVNVDMKALMKLMGLGIKQGDAILVRIEGEDEDSCAAALEKELKDNL